jgi:hypothetical protein
MWGVLGSVALFAESRIDPVKSTFYFTSRSGEEVRPVFGETLNGRIVFKDESGAPLGNIEGKNVQIISMEEGKMIVKKAKGRSNEKTGFLSVSFTPKNPNSKEKIKIAIKAEGVVLNKIEEVSFFSATEQVDQCQPLWDGAESLYGYRTIGQTFKSGNIDNISKINIMGLRGEILALPVLKLYLWKNNYEQTLSEKPLFVSGPPMTFQNPSWKKYLVSYNINCPIKPFAEYYFELSIPDKAGNEKDFFSVWRIRCSRYCDGVCFLCGQIRSDMDLQFYIFYKKKINIGERKNVPK